MIDRYVFMKINYFFNLPSENLLFVSCEGV